MEALSLSHSRRIVVRITRTTRTSYFELYNTTLVQGCSSAIFSNFGTRERHTHTHTPAGLPNRGRRSSAPVCSLCFYICKNNEISAAAVALTSISSGKLGSFHGGGGSAGASRIKTSSLKATGGDNSAGDNPPPAGSISDKPG